MSVNGKFNLICFEAYDFIRRYTPIDTGNLRNNAVKYEALTPTHVVISIDQAIAPYMPYTNEPWLSPRWNGRKNPNEHWWQDTVELLVRHIAEQYRGKVTKL